MTSSPPAGKKRRLGELLKDAGLITELQLKAALAEQRKWGGKLGRTLVEMSFVEEASMAAALSRQLNLPLVDLDALQTPADVTSWLRVDVAERYGVFPLGGDPRQKTLQVATSDPTNFEALQELAFHTGMRIQVSICGPTAIDRAIRKHYYGESVIASDVGSTSLLGLEEQSFDAQEIITRSGEKVTAGGSGGQPLMASAAMGAGSDPYAVTSPRSVVQAEQERQIQELGARLEALEKHAAQQVKALRSLFELLIEKGHISREEYVAKVRARE
ncbi:MAG TPA: hypothetical protein VFB81_04385 [Myxococcales bacterium]|nr:hypothetical protein [Myxococcales bacterium]